MSYGEHRRLECLACCGASLCERRPRDGYKYPRIPSSSPSRPAISVRYRAVQGRASDDAGGMSERFHPCVRLSIIFMHQCLPVVASRRGQTQSSPPAANLPVGSRQKTRAPQPILVYRPSTAEMVGPLCVKFELVHVHGTATTTVHFAGR